MFFLFLSETYPNVILEKKAKTLRQQTGNKLLQSRLADQNSPRHILRHAIIRPLKLLVLSPIVLGLSTFQGICFGCLYLLFTTFSLVYTEQYHWSIGSDGLSFLGMGIGMCVSLALFGAISDPILKRRAGKGELKPEYRLILMFPATLFIAAGLFW